MSEGVKAKKCPECGVRFVDAEGGHTICKKCAKAEAILAEQPDAILCPHCKEILNVDQLLEGRKHG